MDRYAVVGNPIAHSKSPEIHRMFAEQTQQSMDYEKILIELDDFKHDVEAFFSQGGKGLNVTVPFKEQAFDFVQLITERAMLAGAVNTLIPQADGSVIGDNTDGAGLVGDLKRQNWQLKGAKVLLLGAGGAARGVILPLMDQGVHSLVIANRTESKAEQLAETFAKFGKIHGCGFAQVPVKGMDIVINATSASISGDLPPIPESVIGGIKAYDMMYGAKPTAFLAWAQKHAAAKVSDGLGMLVGQAAESFYQWRGVRPEIEPVIAALRSAMVKK